jgi:hypothetical protein
MRLVDQIAEASTDNLRRWIRWVLSRREMDSRLKPDTAPREELEDEARWEVDPWQDRGMY